MLNSEKYKSHTLGLDNKIIQGDLFFFMIPHCIHLIPWRTRAHFTLNFSFSLPQPHQRWFSYKCVIFFVIYLTYSFYLSFPRVLCRILNYFNSKAVSYISVQNQRLTNPKAGNEIGIHLWRHYSDLGPDPAVRQWQKMCTPVALHGTRKVQEEAVMP